MNPKLYPAVNIVFNEKVLLVDCEHYPATPASRFHPGDSDEINIVKIIDETGMELPIPDLADEGGNGDAEEIHSLLLTAIIRDTEEAMATVSIEPWD